MNAQACELIDDFGSAYLKQLWQASNGALVVCGSNRQILQVSQSFCDLFQLVEEDCNGFDLDELITPAPFLPESECVFNSAISGTPISFVTTKAKSSGELTRIFQIAVQINTDTGSKLVCYIFKQMPTSTRQRHSDSCNDKELLFNAFENSFSPSMYTDATGRIIRANATFYSEFGWKPIEISGKNVSEICIPSSILPEGDYINTMQSAKKTLRLRTTRKTRRNGTIPISLISTPINTGAEAGYRIYRTASSETQTTTDVTTRNDFNSCPLPGIHSGMFFHANTDKTRTMKFIAPGSASLAGYSEVEFLSGAVHYASIILNEDRNMVLKSIEDSLETQSNYTITYRIKNSSGETLWVMEQGRTCTMPDGGPDCCIGCIIDISETKMDREKSSIARDRIEKLHSVAAELQQSRSVGDIYRICTEAGQSILNGACSSIFIQDGEKMKQVVSSGREQFDCTKECSPGMVELTLSTISPCYFTSRDIEDDFCPAGKAGACFKLSKDAVFQVITGDNSVFRNIDTRIAELLVGYTQQSLKRIALQHQLISQALHDPLTGIYNRNYFNRIIELEELRARRLRTSIGFIMVDVDKFKMVNDKYGHQTGDRVLQEVAKILQKALRTTDTVLRYGGDEFLIILTRMTRDHCHKVEHRINMAISDSRELHMAAGEEITVSMGHAFWTPAAEESVDDVLGLADSIMYKNKRKKLKE